MRRLWIWVLTAALIGCGADELDAGSGTEPEPRDRVAVNFPQSDFEISYVAGKKQSSAEKPETEFGEVRNLLSQIRAISSTKHGRHEDYNPALIRSQILRANFHEGTEASVNRHYVEDLFENDIVLTVDQAKAILDEVRGYSSNETDTGKKSRDRRQAQPIGPNDRYLWKSTEIPFKFYYADADWQNLIHTAHRHIESHTCIRFVENGTGPDYLLYTRGSGCWSSVGRVGGRQQISIGYGCDAMGIVAHETFHALALWHEQSRTDRDEYINIEWGKIFRGTEANFEKRTPKNSDNFGQPYDLGSVMHYGAKAFSTDWDAYSIVTRDPNYQLTIGQRATVSFKDAKMINMRYCSKICPTQLECSNGGYTDPNNCDRCKCPDGLGGSLCNAVPVSNLDTCRGGELDAWDQPRTITSPPLEQGTQCYWRLRAPGGQRVQVEVQSVSFECDNACSSYVEIKYRKQKISTGARFCCQPPKTPIISEDEEVLIIYRGASDIVKGWLGFQLKYQSVAGDSPAPTISPTTATAATTTTAAVTVTTTTTESPTTLAPTQTTATNPPPPPELSTDAHWSNWGGWSGCTVTCGGCGRRKRVRACYGGARNCIGDSFEYGSCGEQSCVYSHLSHRCEGRLLLPCDLLERLDFGTTRFPDSAKIDDPKRRRSIRSVLLGDDSNTVAEPADPLDDLPFLPMTEKNARILKEIHTENAARRKRFVDGNRQLNSQLYCEKRFTYNCPTSLLTISMDWKTSRDAILPADTRLCCDGYTSRAGKCVKP